MRSQSGFTLIELMIVVVILGILAAIGIPNFVTMQVRARDGATKSNMHTLQFAAEDYAVQNDGAYADVCDPTHIGNLLPPSFRNSFDGSTGENAAWEDRASVSASPSSIPGVASYADSSGMLYNVKGQGKTAALTIILTSGQ